MLTIQKNSSSCPPGESAKAFFEQGYYCAESVLLSIATTHGQETTHLSRLMSGMCGGMGRSGGMCGALLGAVAGFGLLFGRDLPEDDKTTVYTLSHHMTRRFEEEFGSTLCSGVLGCDISTEAGTEVFVEKQLGTTKCLQLTMRAAELACELIADRDRLKHPLL